MTKSTLERSGVNPQLIKHLLNGIDWFCRDAVKRRSISTKLNDYGAFRPTPAAVSPLVEIPITDEAHIVVARGKARSIAKDMGFSHTEQIKITTAVSEVARNIFRYAGRGTISITAATVAGRAAIRVVARDEGPGIPNLDQILEGRFRSTTGLGLGIRGCRSLMDEFSIEAPQGYGTRVTMAKFL